MEVSWIKLIVFEIQIWGIPDCFLFSRTDDHFTLSYRWYSQRCFLFSFWKWCCILMLKYVLGDTIYSQFFLTLILIIQGKMSPIMQTNGIPVVVPPFTQLLLYLRSSVREKMVLDQRMGLQFKMISERGIVKRNVIRGGLTRIPQIFKK